MAARLVEASETEVRIDFKLNTKCRSTITLKSLYPTAPIAFKIQTSSPHKFLVNPPTGLIPPLTTTTFQIILKPQSHLPPSFPRSSTDRFLVKSSPFSSNSSVSAHPESITSWFSSLPAGSTSDIKLKVAFVGVFLLKHGVARGYVECVRNLIKRQRLILTELSPSQAESLLRVATKLDNPEPMVSLLIENGLKVESQVRASVDMNYCGTKWGSDGWNELPVAVANDRRDEVVDLVEKFGMSLDLRDKEGRSPFQLAVSRGSIECVKLLVDYGVDVNARSSNDGRTAMCRAVTNGDVRMVELLIDLGADPTIVDDRGHSALDVARDKGLVEVVEIMERGKLVMAVARSGSVKQLVSLLEKGANVNYSDQYGLTALHVAAIKGNKDVVSVLIEFGADLEVQDKEGHVPLHLAAEGGCLETVAALVNNRANVNTRSKRGATPLHMAEAFGYDEICEFLVSKGASPSLPPT